MGWLFGKNNKVPKVPLPEGYPLPDGALRLPERITRERVIEPGRLKEAAGVSGMDDFSEFDNSLDIKEDNKSAPFPMFTTPTPRTSLPGGAPSVQIVRDTDRMLGDEPLFVQLEVYKEMLGTIEGIRKDITQLHETSKALEDSEYNVDNNFTKLRRSVKSIHDHLLNADKILFKS